MTVILIPQLLSPNRKPLLVISTGNFLELCSYSCSMLLVEAAPFQLRNVDRPRTLGDTLVDNLCPGGRKVKWASTTFQIQATQYA